MSDNDVPVSSESEEEAVQEHALSADDGGDAHPGELTAEQQAQLAELDASLEKFLSQKRWSDVIKTTIAKAELVVDPQQKVELYAEAGRMYVERSSNQAEAIKCFARVLEIDGENLEAIERLKEMYEKRRDWERLVDVMRREAAMLDPADQAMRRIEIAQLATERLRKPAICIDLWQDVLGSDPDNAEALGALSNLYERAREWEPLADVLEKQIGSLPESELIPMLQKLGMIYADKLDNDDGAISAFRRLLELAPDDRRAQEQLKKRYVAAKAWDDLEAFYASTEKWDELIRTLERAADQQGEDLDQRITLLFRVARLWQDKQGKADRAARAYEKVLGLDEANLEAAEALSPIYEQAGDAKKLANSYEVRLQHVEDPDERVALLRETALLYEEKLRNPQLALERFLEAFGLDPLQEVLREDLERLATKVKSWDAVFVAYAAAIEGASHPDDANDLRIHYGRALTGAGNVEDAIAQYRAVYDDRVDDQNAISALEELYRQTERYAELLEVLRRRSELDADPDTRRRLAYDIAALYKDQLEQPDEAIEAYRNIPLEFGEQERDAYRELDVLYEKQERWQDLSQTLEHRIDLGPDSDEELAALKFRLANTSLNHLGERERALELFREVLMIMPEHEGAVVALEGVLRDPELGFGAAAILEPIYEGRGDYEKLVQSLETSLPSIGDRETRIDAITKAGELYAEQLGNGDRAFETYVLAMREAPDNLGIAARLTDLGVQQQRVGEMVELLCDLAGSAQDPLLGRNLWVRAAQLRDEPLNDVDGAVAAYMQALEVDEGDPEVLAALESIFRRTERWAELLDVLRRRVSATSDPTEQQDVLSQMAAIHNEMLGQPEEAIRIHNEIVEVDPTNMAAYAALDALYERQEMWSELADNVNRQLSLVDSEQDQIRLMVKLGELRELRMDAVEAALETYREVLERDPTCAPVLEALNRLLQREEHQLQVAGILQPIYRDANQIPEVISIQEIQVKHAQSADQRVHLLHEMAELYEVALEDLNNAFHCYARALAEEPVNETTQDQLERIAASSGVWQALAETYEAQVESIEDPLLRASLHAKIADIREAQLGDVEGAIRHYMRVLELDDNNLDSAAALERLFHASERYEDLARIYLMKARMLDVPEEQRAYFFRAGAIYEDVLERPAEAVEVYRQSLELEPEDAEALDKLISLHLRLERWEDLLGVYTQKADIVSDPDEKKRLYAEVGAVYERELNQIDKAIDTYQRILEIDPDDLTAVGRLDVLYQSTENWEELLSILEREAELAHDPSEALSFRYRIGELFETRLDDSFRAVEMYRDIVDTLPDHEPSLVALERMIAAGKEPVAAAEVLEPIYRASAESAKLVGVLEVLVQHDPDPIRKVELLHQIAELHEIHLDQPRQAYDAFARALPFDNGNEKTLGAIEQFAESLSVWGEVAQLYDTEIARLQEESPDSAMELALRLAKIFEVQIGDVDNAIKRYRLVFDIDPSHVETLEALDRLFTATDNWTELAPILEREVEVAASPDDILNLQFRLGQLQQHYLNNVAGAIEQYREILAAAPEYDAASRALEGLFAEGIEPLQIGEVLEPLYRMQEAWDRLIFVHDQQLRYQEDKDERIVMMHRIAEIAEQRAGDDAQALMWMQRALLEDPTHDHSLDECERLASMLDGWAVLASTYAQILETDHSKEARVEIAKRLARAYEEELGDVGRAEEAFRYGVALDDTDEDLLSALDRIYSEHGAGNALAEVLRKRVAASEGMDKVDLGYRLGNVLYNDVRDTEGAIATYLAVLDEDPQHEGSIRALQNVYVVTGRWEDLFKAYEREIDVAVGDSAQAEILGKMAVVAWTRLSDLDRAVDLLKRVLDLLGEDPEALNALGNIYSVQENWADLVDVLEREVAVTDDDEMRVLLYSDLGRIWYEKLQRDRNALESWERVLDIDPGSTDALFAMAAIHRAAQAYSELVDTLHRIIDVGTATLEEAAIENVYMQLGGIYEENLEQAYDAVESFRKALELNPRNFEAMQALERIHGAQDQWEDAIEVKGRRVDALEDPQDKVRELLEIAAMWDEKLEAKDRGTEAFTRVLELDPMHEGAFGQLQELHHEAGRFEELIELFLGRVEATESVDEAVTLLRKVAQVNEKDLDDKNQAFEALQLAWVQDFTNEETAKELERMAGLTQRWNELLTTANQSLQEVPEDDLATKNAICVKAARWYGREGHPEYAIPYLQQVLAIDPVNLSAMKQMAELYRQTQQWQVYAQVLAKISDMTEDPAERAEVHVNMGELQEEQFGSAEQAIKHYREALEAVPTQLGALKALERIHRNRSEWLDLIEVLKKKVEALEDADLALAAKLELAEAYEDRVSDKSQAVGQYQRVLEEDPQNIQALKGLERLYAQLERFQELQGVLEAQLEIVTNDREQVTLLMRIAGMCEEQFHQPERAAERLEQVVDIDPTYTEALQGLARLYRQLRKWDELIDTYQRHVDATPDRAEKVEIFQSIGEVYRDELDDSDRAVEAFLSVTGIDDDNLPALQALSTLYEQRGEHSSALDSMERLSRLVTDPTEQVDLFFRMGKLYDAELGDRVAAIEHFQKAIDIDEKHLPALEAMRDIHVDDSDWHAAARVLEQASEVEESARKGAAFRVELGRIYADKLDEEERAIEVFEDAIKLDPDSADAGRPLVDAYTRAERWSEAMPLLQMLVKSSDVTDSDEQQRFWFLLGECAEHTGDDDTAVRAYSQAFSLDSQDLRSLMGLSAAYYRQKDWDNAYKHYQMVLVHHRDELGTEETADTFYRLGVIKREQKEVRKAFNMFDKALEEDELHVPTLQALVELNTEQKDYEQVIHFKKKLLERAEHDEERFNLYEQIGDLWQSELKNPMMAIEAFTEASVLEPQNHKMLHKLLGLYQSTGQWGPAIDIIDQVASLEERPEAKAKYAYTVGVILRDELKDADAALDRLGQALDLDPKGMLKAFEAVNKILTQRKDWKGLERAFRKMLHRVTGGGDKALEFNLWHNLGVIYRDRLKSLESAAEAFVMASKIQPENMQEHQILAEIYSVIPDRFQDAVAEHQILLRDEPGRVNSYRALYKLYFGARQYDKAWCVAATLSFLKKADTEQKQFYEQYRPEGPIRPRSRLNNERWVKDLFHPDEDYMVGKVFEAVTPALLRLRAKPDKTWQLKKKDLIPDVMNTTVAIARTFGFASQVLNLQLVPRLFVCPDRPGGLAYATTIPPATVCGSALLTGQNPLDVVFTVAKHLSYYRGEHYIRTMFQTKDEMKLVLLAAMSIAGAGIKDQSVEKAAAEIRANMQPADMELLNSIGKRFVEAGARTDIKQWMRMVELTGCRAGFLMANDLGIAQRMIQAEPPMGASDLTPKEKIEELILFSVSEQYFRLREALGIQINVG